MKLSEMITQVSDELRNNNIASKIVTWLKIAQTSIASDYEFDSLNAYGTAATSNGNPDITLAADFLWLKQIQIPSLRRPLFPQDESRIARVIPDYRTRKGTVSAYYQNGDITLGLCYVPSGTLNITYGYQKKPIAFPTSGYTGNELSGFPEDWDALLVQMALTRGYKYEGSLEEAALSKTQERELRRGLKANVNKRPDYPLVFGSDVVEYKRLPRPKFPSNYPRVF